MGVVQDFVDSIETWFENLIKSGIDGEFKIISNIMKGAFDGKSASDPSTISGMINSFLSVHPANFTGGGSVSAGATTIWSTIEMICNNAVVPIAGMILVIFLLNDLIQMVIRGNNFKEFDDSIFIKWIIKSVCGIILISNVYYIASGLFSFGTDATSRAISVIFNNPVGDVKLNEKALDNLELGTLLTVFLLSFIVLLGVIIMIVAVIIVLASRMIEVFMYLGISPIPVATLIDGGEFGSVGKNWIKQLTALSFQGFFIILAIGIFKTLFNNVLSVINSTGSGGSGIISGMTTGGSGIIMQMAMLLGYTFALIFTILRTGAISKSAFHAH